jgi:hypothetical protein
MTDTATKAISSLTDAQLEYSVLEREIAQHEVSLKPLREKLNEARDRVVNESGIKLTGEPIFFQDTFGTVHRVEAREYITLPVHPFGISHTRRPELGEAKGSLSEKAAKEAGFEPVINKEPLPDKQIIDRAAAKAAETPIGQPIDMAACFGFDKEQ